MTSNEIRRLYAELILTVQHAVEHILAWSTYRRRSCQRARTSHYRKRLERLERYETP